MRFRATAGVADAVRAWDDFFFRPRDGRLLGVLRWCTGLMLVYTHAVWGLALDDFFREGAWLDRDLVRQLHGDSAAWSFWWNVPDELVRTVHYASLGVLAAFTIGFATRLTSIAAFVIVVSYAHRVPTALFGLDQINAYLTLYTAIGYVALPARWRRLSLDRLLARLWKSHTNNALEGSWSANLGVRLVQLHTCLVYLSAGLSKLQGRSWWDGMAIWRAAANLEYQTYDLTWLAHHPRVAELLTHVTVAWEIAFCGLIWIRPLRPLVLAVGVALHLGIGACLGMWTFALIMLVGCASFLPIGRETASAQKNVSNEFQRVGPPTSTPAGRTATSTAARDSVRNRH